MQYIDHYDVIVAGGGTAGVIAAVSAARAGARTLLVEQNGFLGGVLTAGMVCMFLSFHNMRGEQVAQSIPQEVVDRLLQRGGAVPPGHLFNPYGNTYSVTPFDGETLKVVLAEMVEEAGVDLLLHTFAHDALVREGRVHGLSLMNKAGQSVVTGDIVIDCTGDADAAAHAGASFLAGDSATGSMMPMGMMFRLGNVDIAPTIEFVRQYPDQFILGEDPAMGKKPAELMEAVSDFEDIPIITGFWDLIREKQASGEFPQNRKRLLIYITPFAGVVQINAAAAVGRDGTNPGDLTTAENEARQTVQQLVQFFRNHVPGFSDCFLVDTASAIGVRETRRVLGEYTLTMNDVLKAREFDDTIGLGAYCIDIHESDGGITHYHIEDGQAYRTPYRCLVPRDVDGLLIAGRSISVEREAMGATREQVACMVQGEAAGLAAALCVQQGVEPRHLDVGQLRDALTQRGVPL